MEVEMPVSPPEFFFDSSCNSTPYVSAPSSPPRRLGDFPFFSAPTSPTRAAAVYAELRRISFSPHDGAAPFVIVSSSKSAFVEKSRDAAVCEEDKFDFAFDFSGQLDMSAAEELFEEGRIRTAKPRPLSAGRAAPDEVISSSRRSRKADIPFSPIDREDAAAVAGGGRSSGRRSTRSLSPNRIVDFLWEESLEAASKAPATCNAGEVQTPAPPPAAKLGGRKWSFRDFFLFRSASEGRAVRGKDPLRKYTLLAKAVGNKDVVDDSKESSFRSAEGSFSDRGRSVSVGRKDVHSVYRAEAAVAGEERRRKTFLPYREGLLGCLGFNPSVHGLAKGLHSITQT